MSTERVLCKGITPNGTETITFTATATGEQIVTNKDGETIDVNIETSAVSLAGDMKARSDIADANTSTFLNCDTNGHLEVNIIGRDNAGDQSLHNVKVNDSGELFIQNRGVSFHDPLTSVNLNNGTPHGLILDDKSRLRTCAVVQGLTDIADGDTAKNLLCSSDGEIHTQSKSMGSEDGTTSGTQKQLRVDGNGRLSVDIHSGGVPPTTRNSAGHASGLGVGLMAFEGATARGVACDSNGEVKVLCGYTDIADGSTGKRLLCNASGEQKVVNQNVTLNNREDMGASWTDGTSTTALDTAGYTEMFFSFNTSSTEVTKHFWIEGSHTSGGTYEKFALAKNVDLANGNATNNYVVQSYVGSNVSWVPLAYRYVKITNDTGVTFNSSNDQHSIIRLR